MRVASQQPWRVSQGRRCLHGYQEDRYAGRTDGSGGCCYYFLGLAIARLHPRPVGNGDGHHHCHPAPARWFTKKGVKPGLALILTILSVVGVIALVAFITIASIGKLAGYLPTYAANLSMQSSAVEPSSTGSASGLAALIGATAPVTATSTIQASTAVTSTTGSGAAQSLAGLNLSNLSSAVSPSQVSGTAEAIVVAAAKAVGMMFLVLFIFAFMLSAAFSLRDKSFLSGSGRLSLFCCPMCSSTGACRTSSSPR